ncbi:hypothetical protein CsatA_010183 [Cannabis sativa]
MPLGFQDCDKLVYIFRLLLLGKLSGNLMADCLVVENLDLNKFLVLFKTWSEHASGQIVFITPLYHSRKFLTGDFSLSEIFFWFLSLIALSGLTSAANLQLKTASSQYEIIDILGSLQTT